MRIRLANIYKVFAIACIVALPVFVCIFAYPASAHAEKLYEVLASDSGPGGTVREVWTAVRNIINYLGMAFLVYVAFMNILRIEMNNYAIKKVLPALIMGVILANFSFLICRFFVDLANVACDILINSPGNATGIGSNNYGIAGSFSANFDLHKLTINNTSLNVGLIWQYFLLTLLEFAGAVVILILAFLFFLRNYMIYFLVALSPLAFMVSGIPMAKSAWNQWWTQFTKWTFLPIVSLFWLWLGGKWLTSFTNDSTSLPDVSGVSLLSMLFAGICYYLAITTPFKMGGAIMGQWGKLGKQAWGLTGGKVGEYGKRKAGVWWAGQAENGKWYNPLGHIARAGVNMRDAKAFDEERIKNSYEGAQANMMRNTRSGRNRTRVRDTFGGEMDKARSEVLGNYYDSEAGQRSAENKAKWLAEKANAEDRLKRALGRGTTNFASSETGQNLMAERERINQDALKYETQLAELQKTTTLSFLEGKGRFDNDADRKIINDRILAMTRNLALDEGINKSQQDKVDKIMHSQMHLHNMKEEVASILSQLNDPAKISEQIRENYVREQDAINEKIAAGTATTADRLRLQDINGDLNLMQNGGTNQRILGEQSRIRQSLESKRDEIVTAATDYYQGAIGELGGAIEGMVDLQSTDPATKIKGFDGLAEKIGLSGLGTIMMTRTGKLTSIQVKGDIDKYLGEKTVDEIADDLDPQRVSEMVRGKMKLADGTINPQAVIANYREGRRHLNDPATNREIEGRMLALAQVAKQTSNADSPIAAARLANMMSDSAAVDARVAFNKAVVRASKTKRDPQAYIAQNSIDSSLPPNEVRSILESHMTSRGDLSRLAYSTVMRQPSMGVSNNPGNYLSTVSPDLGAGNHPVAQSPANQPEQMIGAVVSAIRKNPDASYSKLAKTLGGGLEQIARSTGDLKTTLLQSRVQFADTLGKRMGISMSQELRPTLAKALSTLPQNATADQVASKIQEVIPQAKPQIDPSSVPEIVGRAKTYAQTEKAIALLSQTQNVADHKTYIQHFSNMTPAAAQQQLQILTQARRQVENIDTPTPEMLSAVTSALQKTGFAPQQGELVSGPKAIDSLFMAQQAAEASVGSYDQAGKLDLDKANDTLAERFINPEQAGNATPIAERPGLHQDIVPPAQSQAPSGQTPETGE